MELLKDQVHGWYVNEEGSIVSTLTKIEGISYYIQDVGSYINLLLISDESNEICEEYVFWNNLEELQKVLSNG